MIADASAEIERREARLWRLKRIREYHRRLVRESDTLLEELEKLNRDGRKFAPEATRKRVAALAVKVRVEMVEEVDDRTPLYTRYLLDFVFKLQNILMGSPDDDDGE